MTDWIIMLMHQFYLTKYSDLPQRDTFEHFFRLWLNTPIGIVEGTTVTSIGRPNLNVAINKTLAYFDLFFKENNRNFTFK